MSNKDIGDRIDGVERGARWCWTSCRQAAARRRDRPGALGFRTTGEVERAVRSRVGCDLTHATAAGRSSGTTSRREACHDQAGCAGCCGWRRSGLVLAVAALVVPDSAVKSTDIELVKINSAGGVDLRPTSCGSWPSARTPGPART